MEAQSFDRAQLCVDPVGVAYVKPFGGAGAPVTLAHGEIKTHIDRDLSRVPTGKLADGAVLAVLIESCESECTGQLGEDVSTVDALLSRTHPPFELKPLKKELPCARPCAPVW